MEQIRLCHPEYPDFSKVSDKIRELFVTGQVTNGKYVKEFEKEVASFCGSKHAVAVSSCSTGLNLLLSALPPGTEVIIPNLTFVATYEAVKWNNLKPVIVDTDDTGVIDPREVEKHVTDKTSAVLGVHLYGQNAWSPELQEICTKNNIKLFFDGAPIFGENFFNGDACVLSLGPTKILACMGEGGFILTNSDELGSLMALKRTHGHSGNLLAETFGTNGRQTEITAVTGLEQMKSIREQMKKRAMMYERYKRTLNNFSILPKNPVSVRIFVILTDRRDELEKHLNDKGIPTKRYFPTLSMNPIVSEKAVTPRADLIYKRCLALPFHLLLSDSDMDYICQSISEFFEKSG